MSMVARKVGEVAKYGFYLIQPAAAAGEARESRGQPLD